MQKIIDRLNAWAHWKRIEINSLKNSATPYMNIDAIKNEELFLEDIEAVISAAQVGKENLKLRNAISEIREFTEPPKMSETIGTAFVRLRNIRLLTDVILPKK